MQKDFTLGVLLMVISQFFLVAVYLIVEPIAWYLFPVVVFCSYVYMIVAHLGYRIAFEGINVNDRS